MFVNPGGPGSSGVGLRARRLASHDLDGWGDGRFDVVSWDPRGTNRSSPVDCFTSDAGRGPVLGGRLDPDHPGRVEGLPAQDRRAGAPVRRGERRPPGPHLDRRHRPRPRRPAPPRRRRPAHLRRPVVRDDDRSDLHQPVPEPSAGDGARRHRGRGRVHHQRRDEGRQPVRGLRRRLRHSSWSCARAPGRQPVTVRSPVTARASRSVWRGCSPRPGRRRSRRRTRTRPAPSATAISCSPPTTRCGPERLGPASPRTSTPPPTATHRQLEDTARSLRTPAGFAGATTSSAISCLDGPARRPSQAWPSVIPKLTDVSTLYGPVLGWWLWAPCASNWPARSTDRYAGPWDAKTKTPILLMNNRYDPATGYQNAVVAEQRLGNAVLLTAGRLRPPDDERPQPVRRRGEDPLPRRASSRRPRGTVCKADEPPFP